MFVKTDKWKGLNYKVNSGTIMADRKSDGLIRTKLSLLEILVNDANKQHTHEIPYLRGQIDALNWVMESDTSEKHT